MGEFWDTPLQVCPSGCISSVPTALPTSAPAFLGDAALPWKFSFPLLLKPSQLQQPRYSSSASPPSPLKSAGPGLVLRAACRTTYIRVCPTLPPFPVSHPLTSVFPAFFSLRTALPCPRRARRVPLLAAVRTQERQLIKPHPLHRPTGRNCFPGEQRAEANSSDTFLEYSLGP